LRHQRNYQEGEGGRRKFPGRWASLALQCVNGRNLLAQLVKERKEDENFLEDVLDLHCSMWAIPILAL